MQATAKTVVTHQSSVTIVLTSREAVLLSCIIGNNCRKDNEQAIRAYIGRDDYKKALGPLGASFHQDDATFGERLYEEIESAIKSMPAPQER